MELKSSDGLSKSAIVCLVVLLFIFILSVIYGSQYFIDRKIGDSSEKLAEKELKHKKTAHEITKIDAEISRIRSDTAGSIFWLKLIALFVTVGGAVGGYLIGQSRTTKKKLGFEIRKNVDEVYQSIIQELANESPILRAAAAVKLGEILYSFPAEWDVSDARKKQLTQLTKKVLTAALSIETDEKVLKTLTINVILHKSEPNGKLGIVQELDFSGAKANGAYWARCNFEYSDFFKAELVGASFRKSILSYAQFRESLLKDAVFAESICMNTNFKMADLRGASFDRAKLNSVDFENAKVYSVSINEATIENISDCQVDVSINGDGSQLISVSEWLKR